jgi:hypothetical protein
MIWNIICPRIERARERSPDGLRQKLVCGTHDVFFPSHTSSEAFAVKLLGAFGQILRPQGEVHRLPTAVMLLPLDRSGVSGTLIENCRLSEDEAVALCKIAA